MKQKYFIKMFDLIEIEIEKNEYHQIETILGLPNSGCQQHLKHGFNFNQNGLEFSGRIENE